MNIYISSSWENRNEVRNLAVQLRKLGHYVYNFPDPACPQTPKILPGNCLEEFDPKFNKYREYINKPEWKQAVMENKRAIEKADLIILLLPCGADSHAEWALGVGMKKWSVVVGQPRKGEQSPVHHWANRIFDSVDNFIVWFKRESKCVGCGGECLSCFARLSHHIV